MGPYPAPRTLDWRPMFGSPGTREGERSADIRVGFARDTRCNVDLEHLLPNIGPRRANDPRKIAGLDPVRIDEEQFANAEAGQIFANDRTDPAEADDGDTTLGQAHERATAVQPVDTAKAVIPTGIEGKFGHRHSLRRHRATAVATGLRAIVPRPIQEARP